MGEFGRGEPFWCALHGVDCSAQIVYTAIRVEPLWMGH